MFEPVRAVTGTVFKSTRWTLRKLGALPWEENVKVHTGKAEVDGKRKTYHLWTGKKPGTFRAGPFFGGMKTQKRNAIIAYMELRGFTFHGEDDTVPESEVPP